MGGCQSGSSVLTDAEKPTSSKGATKDSGGSETGERRMREAEISGAQREDTVPECLETSTTNTLGQFETRERQNSLWAIPEQYLYDTPQERLRVKIARSIPIIPGDELCQKVVEQVQHLFQAPVVTFNLVFGDKVQCITGCAYGKCFNLCTETERRDHLCNLLVQQTMDEYRPTQNLTVNEISKDERTRNLIRYQKAMKDWIILDKQPQKSSVMNDSDLASKSAKKNDINNSNESDHCWDQSLDFYSGSAVSCQGHCIGVLSMMDISRSPAFNYQHILILNAMADVLSTFMDKFFRDNIQLTTKLLEEVQTFARESFVDPIAEGLCGGLLAELPFDDDEDDYEGDEGEEEEEEGDDPSEKDGVTEDPSGGDSQFRKCDAQATEPEQKKPAELLSDDGPTPLESEHISVEV